MSRGIGRRLAKPKSGWKPTDEALEALEKKLQEVTNETDREYFRTIIMDMLRNNVLPEGLLEHVPVPASVAGKTRFDQLYDAASSVAFPGYSPAVLERLLGPDGDPDMKVWRVMLPRDFGIRHCIIRARTYQEAFGFACDYACRMSLRLYRRIPSDMTIRVQFVSDRALRRTLDIRWRNRTRKRQELNVEGRVFTQKDVQGARLAALGRPGTMEYRLAWYADRQDLLKIRRHKDQIRCSVVEYESLPRKRKAG